MRTAMPDPNEGWEELKGAVERLAAECRYPVSGRVAMVQRADLELAISRLAALERECAAAERLYEVMKDEHQGSAPCFVECDGCDAVSEYEAARAATGPLPGEDKP